jgi:phosphoesterase RecJ-like protein
MHFPSAPADTIEALAAVLERPRSITIIAHMNPDPDALGSSLGLAGVLRSAGHQVQVVMPNTPSGDMHWMPGFSGILCHDRDRAQSEKALRECDVLFCLDFNRPDRVGEAEAALRAAALRVLIDHHRDPDPFTNITFSDVNAPATAQMIVDIVSALGLGAHIDPDVATCLYTGILTDTGSFRFSSTTPHTLRVGARLMELGAVPEKIHSSLSDNNTVDRLKLLGFALSERLVMHPDLKVAVISLSAADLARFNFRPGDTEGLVNYGLSIAGIRLAALVIERPEQVRLSLRSKGKLPVNLFLGEHFNGGGHANASGGHMKAPLQTVLDKLMHELPAFVARYPE